MNTTREVQVPTPMIQTHDGSVFPVDTISSTIRGALVAMGTYESGHGPIADCPPVYFKKSFTRLLVTYVLCVSRCDVLQVRASSASSY